MKTPCFELKDYIGQKVIVRSGSEEESLKIGKLIRYEEHRSGSKLPIVEINDKEMLCFSCILPYIPELYDALKDLDHQDQYNIVVYLKHFVSANARECSVDYKGREVEVMKGALEIQKDRIKSLKTSFVMMSILAAFMFIALMFVLQVIK